MEYAWPARNAMQQRTWQKLNAYAVHRAAEIKADPTWGSPVRRAFTTLRGSGLPYHLDYTTTLASWQDASRDDDDDYASVPEECVFTHENWADPLLDPIENLFYNGSLSSVSTTDGCEQLTFVRWNDTYFEQNGIAIATISNGIYAFDMYKHRLSWDHFRRSGSTGTLADYVWLCALLDEASVLDKILRPFN